MKRVLLFVLLSFVSLVNAQINLNIGSTNVGTAPVSSFFSYSYVQQIYLKQEINTNAAGNITGLIFYLDPSATINDSSNWTVYLGHTTKSAFTSGTDWIPAAQLTQVFAGTVTKNNNKVEVSLTTPFAYNNSDNLVVAARENSPSIDINNFDEAFRVYSHLPNSALYYKGDQQVVDPSAPPGGIRANYKSAITISGLTPSPTGGTDVVNQQVVANNSFTPSVPLNRDTTYYLKINAVSGNAESVGCNEITFKTIPPIPVNDACTGALVASAFPYAYTQNDAISSTNNAGFVSACADNGMNDGLWFRFTGDGSQFTIKVSTSVVSFDPKIGVYSGACDNLVCVGTKDDGGGGQAETITITTTAGTEYFVNVGSFEDDVDKPEDTFTIDITKI